MVEFERHELDNGFKFYLHKNNSGSVFGNLRVNHGALNELPGEEGTAHFLEHMFIEAGSEKYSPAEQARLRDRLGFTNACTTKQETYIPMGFFPEDLETFLDFSSDMMFSPVFDPLTLERQKGIVAREISRKKGSPDFEDMRNHWNSLSRSKHHTYFVLGDEEVIHDLDIEKLKTFRERGYHVNNMDLILAGTLPENIRDLVEKFFGDRPAGNGKRFEMPIVSPLQDQTANHVFAPDLLNRSSPSDSNSYVFVHFVVPDQTHGDSHALEIAAKLVCRSKSTGAYKKIRTDNQLSYEIAGGYNGKDNFGTIGFRTNVLAREQDKAINIYFEELANLARSVPDEEFLERAKKSISYSREFWVKEFGRFFHADPVNSGLVAQIKGVVDSPVELREKISAIQEVSAEDVQRVAQEYFPSRQDGHYVMLIRDPLKNG